MTEYQQLVCNHFRGTYGTAVLMYVTICTTHHSLFFWYVLYGCIDLCNHFYYSLRISVSVRILQKKECTYRFVLAYTPRSQSTKIFFWRASAHNNFSLQRQPTLLCPPGCVKIPLQRRNSKTLVVRPQLTYPFSLFLFVCYKTIIIASSESNISICSLGVFSTYAHNQ
jgi:hypothetical protein